MLYKKPKLKTYSAIDIQEELGPCQSQYTTGNTTLYSDSNNDGWMKKYEDGSPYSLVSTGNYVYVGYSQDSGPKYTTLRSFFSFDISSIQGTVVSATLRLYESAKQGNLSPFTYLALDHVNFGTLVAGADDFDGNDLTLTRNYATTTDYDTSEWKEFDVKTAVQADVNAGRTTSQFRVRFDPDDSHPHALHYIGMYSSSYPSNKPELVVTYRY